MRTTINKTESVQKEIPSLLRDRPSTKTFADWKQLLKDNLKRHVIDSTAMVATTSPIFAAVETFAVKMHNDTSIHARLISAALTGSGLGRAFTLGRDLSREFFKIKPESREWVQQIHDGVYTIAVNLVLSPPFYYAAGERDIKKIIGGTLVAAAFSLPIGGPMCYGIDVFQDLTCLKESERTPNILKNQSPAVKKGIASLLVTTAIGATVLVYYLNSQYVHPVH